jgi:hypothetical protein
MLRYTLLIVTLTVSALLLPPADLSAQSGDFQIANRLMQQQQYAEAMPILRELHQNNPGAHVFFDRYVESLINLDMLDEAEQVARRQMERNHSLTLTTLRLAEILHIKGEREEAANLWNRALDQGSESMQTYYSVASSMMKRREYNKAIDVYKSARNLMGNSTLFLNELANAYMQAGRFEESVKEFYRLVIESPEQMGMVQQRFLRMRDQRLYEIAAFELEDMLFDLDMNHSAYPQLYQLLTWLLLETEEFRRAYNFARYYESETSHTIYSLMALGNQLLSAGQYSYAAEAFRYYVENSRGSNRYRAMEELAGTYSAWARYLGQHNLESDLRQRELFLQAYETAEKLLKDAPGYDRANRVYALLIDLSLDQFKDSEKATNWFEEMKGHPSAEQAYTYYAEGRLALFGKNYVNARQALTRADRATDNANLSERARYYLSLTDFFAGDYEFAEIQLRSLERRHTSFYANDAIKLRMWIRNGQRADTTGSVLKAIGEGLYSIHTGNYKDALPLFEPILANANNPFADDLTVELAALLPPEYNSMILYLIERQISARSYSPLLERMMWDRAIIAEQMYESGTAYNLSDLPYLFRFIDSGSTLTVNLSAEDRFFGRDGQAFSIDRDFVSDLYEEIIIKFPDGFYASFAREKLQSVELTYL